MNQNRTAADAVLTIAMVRNRLIEAADVIRPESAEASPEQIQRARQALQWLAWLGPDDARLVQARAGRTQWKMICWRFALSRPTAHRRWERSLSLIALRLNGCEVPSRCSRRELVRRARALTPPKCETFSRTTSEAGLGY